MFKSLFIVAAVTFMTAPTFAQEIEEKPFIEITGTAEKQVVPDEIYISIVLRERDEGKKSISIESQEADLKKAVIELGIPIEKLTLSGTDADYVKVSWKKHDVLTNKSYQLMVTTAEMAGKLFEKLDAINIDGARISHVSHSKIVELRQEVRIAAIKAAKEKADYLLNAIDQETGMALIVREQDVNSYNYNRNMSFNTISYANFGESAELPQIQFKKIKLDSSIYVKFEIK